VDEAKLDRIAGCIERHWPEAIAPEDLADPGLPARVLGARRALLEMLELAELV
jgi:succinylarginine dihydrolase